MKKLTTNKIIIYITAFILTLLFTEELIEIRNSIFLFEISPSFTMLLLNFGLLFILPLIIGFIFAIPFLLFIKKENFKKNINYILYFAFFFLILFFFYHLIERYTDIFKNFYGFTDFSEFMYYFSYDKGPLLWAAVVQFCIDTLTFFLFATKSWISLIIGFIFHLYLETQHTEKKRES